MYCLVVLLLGFGLYAAALRAPFTFDDMEGILRNAAVRDLGNIQALWDAFNTRFLTGLTFSFNFALGREDVLGYHVFNVLIHSLNAVLLYLVVTALFKVPAVSGVLNSLSKRRAAVFTSLLFLVHPIQTQAVNYIWQRSTVLSTFFYLAAVFSYLNFRRNQVRLKKAVWFASVFLAMCLGMFCKENIVTLPLLLLVCEFFFFGFKSKKNCLKRMLFLAPLFLILPVIPLLLMRGDRVHAPKFTQATQGKFLTLIDKMPAVELPRDEGPRAMHLPPLRRFYPTQVKALSTYLRLFVAPYNQSIDHLYPLARSMIDPAVLASLCLLVLLMAGVVSVRRRMPLAVFGALWFFLAISVETLVPSHNLMMEHRLYLPSAGLCLVAGALFLRIADKGRIAFLLPVIVLALFFFMTIERNRVWADGVGLWRDALEQYPDNHRAQMNLGAHLCAWGRNKEAIPLYRQVLAVNPDHADAHNNLAAALMNQGNLDEARKHLLEAVRANPDFGLAFRNLGDLHVRTGERQQAAGYYRRSLDLEPEYVHVRIRLARVLVRIGKTDEAISRLSAALEYEPRNFEVHRLLGHIFSKKKLDFVRAEKHFKAALEIEPQNEEVLLMLEQIKAGRSSPGKADNNEKQTGF